MASCAITPGYQTNPGTPLEQNLRLYQYDVTHPALTHGRRQDLVVFLGGSRSTGAQTVHNRLADRA